MIGCCGAEGVKFRTNQGAIDNERLTSLTEKLRVAGCTEKQLERVKILPSVILDTDRLQERGAANIDGWRGYWAGIRTSTGKDT